MSKGGHQYPLDSALLLGPGAHVQIRAVVGTNNRMYMADIPGHAQMLRGAGASAANSLNLLLHLCANVAQAVDVTAAVTLAAGLFPAPHNWDYASTLGCVTDFLAARNGQTAQQWRDIGRALGTNQRAGTTAMARLPGWNHTSILPLAQAFGLNNVNNLTPVEWAQIAAALPANAHAAATVFARVPGVGNTAWNAASALQLAQAYAAANPNAFTAAQWVGVANLLPANAHADTATLARAANWPVHADVLAIATRFGANAHNQSAADWIAVANRIYPRNNWAQYTERAMEYLDLGWPDQVAINPGGGAVNWHLEASADGVVYRQTGVQNPHLTLHGVNGGPVGWANNPDLHVVTGGVNSPWDYLGRNYDPFLQYGQQRPVPDPLVVGIVNSFCTAMHI